MSDKENCGNCGACVKGAATPQNLTGTLECRAGPPQIFTVLQISQQGAQSIVANGFPSVEAGKWCAQWRPKAPALSS